VRHNFSLFFGRHLAKRDSSVNLIRFCLEVLTFQEGSSLLILISRRHFARSYVQKLTFFSVLDLHCSKNTPYFVHAEKNSGVHIERILRQCGIVRPQSTREARWLSDVEGSCGYMKNSIGKPKGGGPPYWVLSMELRINIFKRTSLSRNIKHKNCCSYRCD
jgi:hypothetical protein